MVTSVTDLRSSYTWKNVAVGAGGFMTGVQASDDGHLAARTDVFGAYYRGPSDTAWQQVVTYNSMPSPYNTVDFDDGCYEIAIAPSNPDIAVMGFSGLLFKCVNFTSANRTWTTLSAWTSVLMSANGKTWRYWGGKMRIDPLDVNHWIIGTEANGAFRTIDGGTTFTAISTIPVSAQNTLPGPDGGYVGVTGIKFDRSSSAVGGRTGRIYASSFGHGLYVSTDAGATWSVISGGITTGGKSAKHLDIATDGIVYLTESTPSSNLALTSGAPNHIWSYNPTGSVWTDMGTLGGSNGTMTVACDPHNAARVISCHDGGGFFETLNRGSTWRTCTFPNTRVGTGDVTWLSFALEDYMSCGDLIFDPITPNKLWFAEGIGMWQTTLASGGNPTWNAASKGIENLVANELKSSPTGKTVMTAWDRALFHKNATNLDTYPANYGPRIPPDQGIMAGWAVDYASNNGDFFVAKVTWGVDESAYSADGGVTWQDMVTKPSPGNAGMIAAATSTNWVFFPTGGAQPLYTTNGGTTWLNCAFAGISWPQADFVFSADYVDKRWSLAADRVNIGTFYCLETDGTTEALWRSTDGGVNWSKVFNGTIVHRGWVNANLKTVPGKAGHIWACSGQVGTRGDYNSPAPDENLSHSEDGGATWTVHSDITEVYSFGFGTTVAGASYPSIYFFGWVNGATLPGFYRSDDKCATLKLLADMPNLNTNRIATIDGDKTIDGQAYVSFTGSGWAYGTPSGGGGGTHIANVTQTTGLPGQTATATLGAMAPPQSGGSGFDVHTNWLRILH